MTERYPFGPPVGQLSVEQRLFEECVKRASQGEDVIFPLRIKKDVSVPFIPQDGRDPMIVDASIGVDLRLRIIAERDELAIHSWSLEDGDAGSATCVETPVFVRDGFSMGGERGHSAGMAIPDYLREIAVKWLTSSRPEGRGFPVWRQAARPDASRRDSRIAGAATRSLHAGRVPACRMLIAALVSAFIADPQSAHS